MAELYLKQGHRERALAIYRGLAATNPTDANLARRLAEIEGTGGAMSFKEHLQSVVDAVPGAASAAVLGFDGIVIETYDAPQNPYDNTVLLTEYAAIAQQLGLSSTRAPDVGEFRDMHVTTDNVSCLVRLLTSEYIMAVLLTPQAMAGKARHLMRLAAPLLAKELG